MIIHTVGSGETLQTIANTYNISEEELIESNELTNPNDLIIGQRLVIAPPEVTYTIKEGDTLEDIASSYNITLMELLANNPYLSEREYIYPGDTLVIKYNKKGSIITHGNTPPYIDISVLRKTLPYLTYLSILNYTITAKGDIITYYDDTEVIQETIRFGVAPLMLVTTYAIQGEANIRATYELLLNQEIQNTQIKNILEIIRSKGYYGVNISLQYINQSNINLFESYLENISTQLNKAGYPVFITINPNIIMIDNEVVFEEVDYSLLGRHAQNVIIMSYEWAANTNPPSPISSIYNTELFINYILNYVPSEKIILGIATIGYDWEIPYAPGISTVNSISFDRVNNLAKNSNTNILFDELSQTPFFRYISNNRTEHIVWFINAQTIDSSLDIVERYNLGGISIWNITIYNSQLWLIVNSQYDIKKID